MNSKQKRPRKKRDYEYERYMRQECPYTTKRQHDYDIQFITESQIRAAHPNWYADSWCFDRTLKNPLPSQFRCMFVETAYRLLSLCFTYPHLRFEDHEAIGLISKCDFVMSMMTYGVIVVTKDLPDKHTAKNSTYCGRPLCRPVLPKLAHWMFYAYREYVDDVMPDELIEQAEKISGHVCEFAREHPNSELLYPEPVLNLEW